MSNSSLEQQVQELRVLVRDIWNATYVWDELSEHDIDELQYRVMQVEKDSLNG
jgi:hypothetical protein